MVAERERQFRVARRQAKRMAAVQQRSPAERDRFVVGIVPYNRARLSRLPATRRRAFEAHLRSCLDDALRDLGAGVTPAEAMARDPHPAPMDPAVQGVLWAACATCRGQCCMGGGPRHAFITTDSVRAYLVRTGERDPATILAAFRAHMPTHSLTGGCVYQGATGCTLPRDMRASLCNRFLCDSLVDLTTAVHAAHATHPPTGAFLMRREGRRLSGGRFALPILPARAT